MRTFGLRESGRSNRADAPHRDLHDSGEEALVMITSFAQQQRLRDAIPSAFAVFRLITTELGRLLDRNVAAIVFAHTFRRSIPTNPARGSNVEIGPQNRKAAPDCPPDLRPNADIGCPLRQLVQHKSVVDLK